MANGARMHGCTEPGRQDLAFPQHLLRQFVKCYTFSSFKLLWNFLANVLTWLRAVRSPEGTGPGQRLPVSSDLPGGDDIIEWQDRKDMDLALDRLNFELKLCHLLTV